MDVEAGAEVFAGTINGPGALTMRTLRAAGDTTLAQIIEMVEEAQAQHEPFRFLGEREDRLARREEEIAPA